MSCPPSLHRPGKRRMLAVSPAVALNVLNAALETGLTQRIVMEELLSDAEGVRIAARRARAKLASAERLNGQ